MELGSGNDGGARGERAPRLFAEEVRVAAGVAEAGRLGLLGLEAREYGWRADGLALVAAGLRRVGGAGAGRVARELGCGWEGAHNTPGGHAIVFTGHMIDAPGREEPRFPASAEGAAREAIKAAVLHLKGDRPGAEAHPNDDGAAVRMGQTDGGLVGLAGGASGGDLLFHEVCAELGIATALRLTLPREKFVELSVAPAGAGWVARFDALLEGLGQEKAKVLSETLDLPPWMGQRDEYDAWQRTNLWLVEEAIAAAGRRTLLALWDGKAGDGPGGTQHLVEAAARYGIEVAPPIMTRELF